MAYKFYSIITYSDNTGIAIITGIRKIVTVDRSLESRLVILNGRKMEDDFDLRIWRSDKSSPVDMSNHWLPVSFSACNVSFSNSARV